MSNVQLICGDCITELDKIPDNSIDLAICDPPYLITTKSAASKIDSWADYCNAAFFHQIWADKVRKKLKETACLWIFLNWKTLVTFQKMACSIDWTIESLLVWDKGWIGPGGLKGLRPSYELVALFAMPNFKISNRSLRDIQKFSWSSHKPHGHPAEKPVELIKWIVKNCSSEGDTVLDAFMGSGTTGEACIDTRRNFVGIEMSEKYFAIAKDRIEAAQAERGDE